MWAPGTTICHTYGHLPAPSQGPPLLRQPRDHGRFRVRVVLRSRLQTRPQRARGWAGRQDGSHAQGSGGARVGLFSCSTRQPQSWGPRQLTCLPGWGPGPGRNPVLVSQKPRVSGSLLPGPSLGAAQMRVAGRGLGWASSGSPWGPSWEAAGSQAGTGSGRAKAEALARLGWGSLPACLPAGCHV